MVTGTDRYGFSTTTDVRTGCSGSARRDGSRCSGLEGVKVSLSNAKSGVAGDAGLGPRGIQNFADGFITGKLYVDPTATNTKSNNVVVGGGTVRTSLAQAVGDARTAASTMAGLPTTRTLPDLKGATTIQAAPGLNVLRVANVDLGAGKTVVLAGDATSVVVLNVTGTFKLAGGAIRVQGGLVPSRVRINVVGTGADVALSGGGTVDGEVLATARKAALSGASIVNGLLIAGGNIALSGGSQVRSAP